MRQLYYIVVALLLCGACDKQGGYVIRGSFPGLKDGMIVKLNQIEDPFNEINLSIDTVRNGQFKLKGVTPSPVFCKITISNKDLVTDKKEITVHSCFSIIQKWSYKQSITIVYPTLSSCILSLLEGKLR